MKNVVRAGSFLFVLTVAVHALAAPPAAPECDAAARTGQAEASAGQSPGAPLSSCCDDSTFSIFNDSDDTWVVENVDVKSGKFAGISVGDTFGTESTLSGVASSASGSNGNAKGTITIKAGGGNDRFDLTYWFVASTMYGSCPCRASVSTNPLHSGPYTANAATTTGQHNGEAKVKWDLSN